MPAACFICRMSYRSQHARSQQLKYFCFPQGRNRVHTLKKWLEFCRLPPLQDDVETYWQSLGFKKRPEWCLCSLHFRDNVLNGRRLLGCDEVPQFLRPFGPDHCTHVGENCCKRFTAAASGHPVGDSDVKNSPAPARENAEVSTLPAEGANLLDTSDPFHNELMFLDSSELPPAKLSVVNKNEVLLNLRNSLCRICGQSKESLSPILSEDEASAGLTLRNKLELYLHIEITADGLPLNICLNCHELVESWHKLYVACSAADTVLRDLFSAEKNVVTPDVTEEIRSQKIKPNEDDLHSISNSLHDCAAYSSEKQTEQSNCVLGDRLGTELNTSDKNDIVKSTDLPSSSSSRDDILMNTENREDSENKSFWDTDSGFYKSCQFRKGKSLPPLVLDSYTCKYCNEIFPSWGTCNIHKIQCKVEPTVCEVCGAVIGQKSLLKRHLYFHKIRKDKAKELHICEVCGKKMRSLNGLQGHMNTFHNAEKIGFTSYCEPCCRVFSSMRSYEAHKKYHEAGTLKCNLNCKVVVPEDSNSEEFYKCPVCDKSFNDKLQVIRHMNMKNVSKCSKCKRAILNERRALLHKCKWWCCQFCDKQFTSKINCLNHENTHKKEKPHICRVCGQKFSSSRRLVKHRKSHASPIFQCDQCHKIFRNEVLFHIHLETHQEKCMKVAYKCVRCNKTFRNKVLFKIHLERHDREYFSCMYCDKQLMYRKSLIIHYRKFHKDSQILNRECNSK